MRRSSATACKARLPIRWDRRPSNTGSTSTPWTNGWDSCRTRRRRLSPPIARLMRRWPRIRNSSNSASASAKILGRCPIKMSSSWCMPWPTHRQTSWTIWARCWRSRASRSETSMKLSIIGRALAGLLCAAAANAATAPARAAEEVKLNVILPLTGPGAFLGKEEQAAMQLGEKLVNEKGGIKGRTLRFMFHDDQSKPQVAVQLLQEILAEKPSLVIGSAIVANCSAMMPLMAQGPVQYCLSPTIKPEPGSYVFTSNISTDDQNRAIIRYFRLSGLKRIGLITATDAMGQLAEQSIEQVLKLPENKEMVLVHKAEFNPADVSVAAQIERLKAAAPDAVLAWNTGCPPPSAGACSAARQIRSRARGDRARHGRHGPPRRGARRLRRHAPAHRGGDSRLHPVGLGLERSDRDQMGAGTPRPLGAHPSGNQPAADDQRHRARVSGASRAGRDQEAARARSARLERRRPGA